MKIVNMRIGVSIVHLGIKVPKLVQMIDVEYKLINYPLSIQDGRHKIQFFDISTSDGGDFPRIIESALLFISSKAPRSLGKITAMKGVKS